ncbi:MAG: hypothetical protein ABJ084_03815 [Halioglobus sp.]
MNRIEKLKNDAYSFEELNTLEKNATILGDSETLGVIENVEANDLIVYDEGARLRVSEYLAARNVGGVQNCGDCASQVGLPLLNKKPIRRLGK